ncbi:hypothetical protein KAFR_0D04560 [Kazachstania africana CBS 2517]|uniref:Small ribosomal subunit protein mS41 n=1 Tax=Kazachstania africana (strain ATCC 22294 / BCRC 22015 / CBS 2517 / CECT 1963 / NBRC 1671 / NRRL Y-8276) TaxID=1071382 RepID=H2AUQ4_KAZAF|nr:hypothetical protein KAFR_0D04560 [Kazachstania africana CBS 2517]CCF58104.1 hypothetical protein KAFR_0D04560 [Kazachstania africana CBS 2517]
MLSRRLLSITRTLSHVKQIKPMVPKPTDDIPTVATFLEKIGRDCSEFTEVFEDKWSNLFTWDSAALKEKNIPIRQRRYILSQVEHFRNDSDVREIKRGKKSFFGGERKRKENMAKSKHSG